MWQRYHGQNVIANVVQPRQSTPAVQFLDAFDEIDLCEKAVEEKIALKPHMFFHAYVYFPKTMPMQPGPKQGTRSAEENIAYQKRLAVGKRGCVQKWRVCEERERERGRRHSVRYMHVLYSHTLTCLAPPPSPIPQGTRMPKKPSAYNAKAVLAIHSRLCAMLSKALAIWLMIASQCRQSQRSARR